MMIIILSDHGCYAISGMLQVGYVRVRWLWLRVHTRALSAVNVKVKALAKAFNG